MKKYLLSLVALVCAMNVFAEDSWVTKKFSPVSSESDLAGIHTTVAADGSVYSSSTINQQLQFGTSTIAPEGGLLSSCVVKYNAEGEEQWAVLLYGMSTISSMITDADGNCYVVGSFMDSSLDLQGTDGNQITLAGDASYLYGFVAKITADGKFVAAKSILTNTNSEVAISEYPMYMGEWDAPYLTVEPMKVKVDGSKVYVSLSYKGDVSVDEKILLNGAYSFVWDYYYVDNNSKGVISFNSSDLSGAQMVACVQMTNNKTEADLTPHPEAMDFVVMSGMVGVAFIGWGNLTLSTPTQSKAFEFKMMGEGLNEHGMVLSMLTDIEHMSLVYHAAPQDKEYTQYNLFGEMSGTNIILGGTFSGQFPLDNSKYSKSAGEENKYNHASFLATISPMTSSVNYSWVNEAEDESFTNGMVVTGEETHVGTDAKVYHFKTANLEEKGSESMTILDAAQFNDQYVALVSTDGADVVTMFQEMSPSAVQEVKAADVSVAKYFGIDGTEIPAPQKGLSIDKTADGVVKIAK